MAFYSFRSSSAGLETGEWRRCRSFLLTQPASLRSHDSRPAPLVTVSQRDYNVKVVYEVTFGVTVIHKVNYKVPINAQGFQWGVDLGEGQYNILYVKY